MYKRRKLNLRRSTRSTYNTSSSALPSSSTLTAVDNINRKYTGDKIGHSDNYYLKWDKQSIRILNELTKLYSAGDRQGTDEVVTTDVTLFSSEGACVQAHKIVLMLCSPYFQKLFLQVSKSQRRDRDGSAIVVLGNVKTSNLQNLISFIYTGKVSFFSAKELEEFQHIVKQFGIEGVSSSTSSSENAGRKDSASTPTPTVVKRRGRPPSTPFYKNAVQKPQTVSKNFSDTEDQSFTGFSGDDGGVSETSASHVGRASKDSAQEGTQDPASSIELGTVTCKTEPVEGNVDRDDCEQQDTGSNFSDDFLGDDDNNVSSDEDDQDKRKDPDVSYGKRRNNNEPTCSKKPVANPEVARLNARTGRLQGWTRVDTFSPEVIKKDWRQRSKCKFATNITTEFYCAQAGKRKCPARMKIKHLLDGTEYYFVNVYEHANHRTPEEYFGLTEEQKKFLMECLESGVTRPRDLLLKCDDSGILKPTESKLANFLQSVRKKYGDKYKPKREPELPKMPKRVKVVKKKNDGPPKKKGRPRKDVSITRESSSSACSYDQHQHSTLPTSLTPSSKPNLESTFLPTPTPSSSSAAAAALNLQTHPNHYLGPMAFQINPSLHPLHPSASAPPYPFDHFR